MLGNISPSACKTDPDSDLGRAQETASIVADHAGHSVEIDSRLRERNYGVLEGLTVPEIKARHSKILNQLNGADPDYIIPEGESHWQHYRCNVEFIEELLAKRSGATVAVVAHGGVLDSIFPNNPVERKCNRQMLTNKSALMGQGGYGWVRDFGGWS